MNIRHIHLEEVDSTNNYLQGYHPSPGEDVTIVWTEVQTAGRGCDTNSWECEPHANLAFSVLFHPKKIPATSQFIISMANALALRDALSKYVEGITVKWPNDIYWNDYKMAGTLIEPSLHQGYVGRCIIGTGINVNQKQFLSDAPNPISLTNVCGQTLEREEVAQEVTSHLLNYITLLHYPEKWESIRKTYRKFLYRREGIYTYQTSDGKTFEASLHTVEDNGTLVLCEHTGENTSRLRKFSFKEVKFII